MIKRIFDLFTVIVGLMVIWPIFLILAITNFWVHGRPVLFSQVRPGLHSKPFRFYKFRTMTQERDENGDLLPDEQRLTSFGEWLRKTSLDELPSLYNVLKGEMSLVGPRPLLMEYLPLYNEFQKKRHDVKPGITGWAQVNGRNVLPWPKKFELDVWYVENQSFWLDLKILFLTVYKVFKREGISEEGEATVKYFKGND